MFDDIARNAFRAAQMEEEEYGQSPGAVEPADEEAEQAESERDRSGTATQAPREEKPAKSPPKQDQLPPFKVILHNDAVNDMGYVVQTIVKLTPLSMDVAVRCMLDAHEKGQSLLLTTHKEHAELYRDQLKSKSLTVSIQKV